jgi:hypothetical protein
MTGQGKNDPKGVWPETLGGRFGGFFKNHIINYTLFQGITISV